MLGDFLSRLYTQADKPLTMPYLGFQLHQLAGWIHKIAYQCNMLGSTCNKTLINL